MFARTGHLAAAVACHSFCNWMGLPDLDFLEGPERMPWLSPHERRVRAAVFGKRRLMIAAFFLGMGLFGYLLFPMMDPAYYESPLWREDV